MESETNFLLRVLETQGFAIIFGISVLYFFGKNAPRFLSVWAKFTEAIAANTKSMETLAHEYARQMETSRSMLEEVKELKRRVDEHDEELRENQEEILSILREIVVKVRFTTEIKTEECNERKTV